MGNSLCRGGDDVQSPEQPRRPPSNAREVPGPSQGASLGRLSATWQGSAEESSEAVSLVVGPGDSSRTPVEEFHPMQSGQTFSSSRSSSAELPAPLHTTPRRDGGGRASQRLPPAPPSHHAPRPHPDSLSPTKRPEQPLVHAATPPEDDEPAHVPVDESKVIRWQRGELIGAGAFGRVYMGLNLDTGELMAVKQVLITAKDQPGAGGAGGARLGDHVTGLESEVAVLRGLQHRNIVRYVGTQRTDESLNIFLEYVPGGSIASLLSKFGCFQDNVVRMYTRQLLAGLAYLHKHQIIHRDIKGANVLVDNHGTVKLADFGASKKIEDLVTIESGYKSIKGTPYWMAPEVIRQEGHGRQADIWSLGCTVLEMYTGKPPWSQFSSQVSALFHIASSTGPPPIPDELPPDARDFLLLCFRRTPKERPNATQLLKHPFVAAGAAGGGGGLGGGAAPLPPPPAAAPAHWTPPPALSAIEESLPSRGTEGGRAGPGPGGSNGLYDGAYNGAYISSSEEGSYVGPGGQRLGGAGPVYDDSARESAESPARSTGSFHWAHGEEWRGGGEGGGAGTPNPTTPTDVNVAIPSPGGGWSPEIPAPGRGGGMRTGPLFGGPDPRQSAASTVGTDLPSFNPMEEPSWLNPEVCIPLDTGSMHVEGVREAPTMEARLSAGGAGGGGAAGAGAAGAGAGEVGAASPPVDARELLDYVRTKASFDHDRLTTPFRAGGGAAPPAVGSAGGGGGSYAGGGGGVVSYPPAQYSSFDPYDIPLSAAAAFGPGGAAAAAAAGGGGGGGAAGAVGAGVGGSPRAAVVDVGREGTPAVTSGARDERDFYEAQMAAYHKTRESKKQQWEAELEEELRLQRQSRTAAMAAQAEAHKSLANEVAQAKSAKISRLSGK